MPESASDRSCCSPPHGEPARHADRHASHEADPQGPPLGLDKVIRGGSYLCRASRRRYRVSARSSSGPGSSAGKQGLRCARDDAPTGAR
ncbi:SUMF1/EgtB/PvdO family nonheme iron enzyme [Streptomyces sp. NPDC001774]